MNKIFGLDLGTNSIGWAIRNPNLTDNQIEKFGVLTFNKGVGLGKTGEYSYAAERTKHRSTRRLYQARKYRLWSTLENLIKEGYCPLSIEDLNKWRHYDKEEARKNNNAGRVYPIWNMGFDAWIKLDFDGDGKPDYTSPYQLRKELAETKLDFTQEVNRFKLGRALYHIAQRRGFKSSRKGADDVKEQEVNVVDENETTLQKSEKKKTNKLKELFPDYDSSVPVGVFLANKENQGIRVRLDITQYLVREDYKKEIKHIFQFQELRLEHPLYLSMCVVFKTIRNGKEKSYIGGTIFYKRPLRSQKGLIGKCTLEPNKYRAPISHPSFEIFRAWSFLNNIKYKHENGQFEKLPLEIKQKIYTDLFVGRLKAYFPFSDIEKLVNKTTEKKWLFNYKSKTTVTACPVSARLKDIFGDKWDETITKKDANGEVVYITHKDNNGNELGKIPLKQPFYQDIWHVLFSYEDQEYVTEFAESKLNLDAEKTKQFVIAWNACPVGYGMLSLNAINKINVFLEKGLIYTEAVLLANIPEIIGKELWLQNEKLLLASISGVITENRNQKTILNIVNSLISKHKNIEVTERHGHRNNDYKLADSDFQDIQTTIEEQFGTNKWNGFPDEEKQHILNTVKDCYQAYFSKQGIVRDIEREERIVAVQSSGKNYYKTDTGYYRLPKLIDTLKEFLQDNFDSLDEKQLSKIYHPSEINIYPPAKEDKDGILKLGSPKTGSFKNPMAMRTLHELRKLMNYMIETKQVDNETRIVVEVARDLNDANKRWAIEAWQREREKENEAIASKIQEFRKNNNVVSDEDIDKARLLLEQQIDINQDNEAFELKVTSRDIYKKVKERNKANDDLIKKYRLWLEQGMQCLYTGKIISLQNLFDENTIDFEHTIPRSKSFDNSLTNLTVCFADYNRTIKKNQIPSQLPNYSENSGGYTAILPRLKAWEEKIERIKQQIDYWKTKSKKAADKTGKDNAIRQRHLWQMELDYWKNKLDRFTITEITSGFKNSQKVDTQLISKYAFHYLKTYFDKVDVQKGSITAEFRKIYQLEEPGKKKDRSKHSHHAKDAAVLTLIPVAVKRDEILERYYEAKEKNPKATFTEDPYKGFKREFVFGIDDNVLINNITNNQELTPAKRKVRKRGKEVIIDGKNRWATGDTIRGQLHQETFYGAIKPAKRGEKGNIEKDENGKFIQEDNVKYVLRVPFNADFTGVDKIVDEGLKKQIQEHIKRAGNFKKAFEEGIYLLDKNGKPHGNKIRHIRVFKDGEVKEPLAIKKQTNLSDKEYKQHYWAANGENSFFAIYIGEDKKDFDYRNLFDTAKVMSVNPVKNPKDLFEPKITISKGKKITELPLAYVLEIGLKVLFKKEKSEDLKSLSNNELGKRLYVYSRFEKDGRLNFQYHLEARHKIEEAYSDSEIDFLNPKPTLRFGYAKYDFLVEGYDFKIKIDGTIKWLK